MAENVIMPKLGMTMKQGKVTKWHYKEGDRVEAGDVIAEIETDKINYEIEAPISGQRLFLERCASQWWLREEPERQIKDYATLLEFKGD